MSFPNSHLEVLRTSLQRIEKPLHLHPHQFSEGMDWNWCSWTDNWNHVMKPLVLGKVEQVDR